MQGTELQNLLDRRFRHNHKTINKEALSDFVGVSGHTIQSWISGRNKPMGGLQSFRLWHFLAAIGIDSPELDRVQQRNPYGYFIGLLLTYNVISIEEAQEICKAGSSLNMQDVFRHVRGASQRGPQDPAYTLAELKELYSETLAEKQRAARKLYGMNVGPDAVSVKEPTKEAPPAEQAVFAEPAQELEPVVPTDSSKATAEVAPESLPLPSSTASVPMPPPPAAHVDTEAVVTQVAAMLRPLVDGRVANGTEGRRELIIRTAERLLSLRPVLTLAITELNDEDRAMLRELMGDEAMFDLSTLINKLCSTRAYNGGMDRRG